MRACGDLKQPYHGQTMQQFPSVLLQSIHQRAQPTSFIGLQEAEPKVSSHSLRQSDPHQWFVAAAQATIFPPHPLLCLEALGWRVVAGGSYGWWQHKWWATRPWQELMRHAWVMRIQSGCREQSIKEDYQVRAFTGSLPHLNVQPDRHSQQRPARMVTWQLCDLICGVWDTQYSQWRQVQGKKRHLPSCFFISCGVSLKRQSSNL